VLYELSEASLYNIHTEIMDMVAQRGNEGGESVQVVGVLGTVLDEQLLQTTVEHHQIETIYHVAAYKHVPIVEANPIVGLRNNTFGALKVAEVARRCNVARVVLVSTDKAVRPTSVMGASKRLSELIFQCHAAEIDSDSRGDGDTVFAIVRFGNVLGSSGSVVERFRCQIEAGGPVTVTHPDIIRYFMSIPEAAALVIQAGAMARGGEVFVLDMGEPIKITELAQTMIRLMGLEVRDEATPEGDIAIKFIGLRPGEKLYEELLIDEHAARTEHPRIRRNAEPFLTRKRLQEELDALEKAMQTGQIEQIHAALARSVEGYKPDLQEADVTIAARWMPASRTLH
jgi:FlaA1/EpsC-like NDP-sugar epimerase